MLPGPGKPTRAALARAMRGHALDQAQPVGTYRRSDGGHSSGKGE